MRTWLVSAAVVLACATSTQARDGGQEDVLFSGVVVDADGKPVRAELELRSYYRPRLRAAVRFPTDAQGRYAITRGWLAEHVPPYLVSLNVVFHDPRGALAPASQLFDRSAKGWRDLDRTIALKRGGEVTVVALDGDRPVPGAVVTVVDRDAVLDEVTTGAQGRAVVGPLPEGSFRLAVHAPGFAPLRLGGELRGARELTARLVAGHAIAGRVLGPDGEPLARAVVGAFQGEELQSLLPVTRWVEEQLAARAWREVHGRDPFEADPSSTPRDLLGRFLAVAVTDDGGRFDLRGLLEDDLELVVTHARFTTTIVKTRTAAADALEVTLGRGGTIHGIARRLDGTPAVGVVEVGTPMGPALRLARVNADGSYEVEGVAARAYAVRLSDDGTAQDVARTRGERADPVRSVNVTVPEGGRVRCDFGTGARVGGRLVPAKGSLPPMVTVALALEGQQDQRQRWLLAHAGADGAFVFPEVPPGKYVAGVVCYDVEDDPSAALGKRAKNERLERLGEVAVAEGVRELVLDLEVPERVRLR